MGLRILGCTSPAPQVLPHPPAAPSRRAGTKGGCSCTLRCWDVPGQIPLASMQPPQTGSAGVQRCRDVLGRTQRGLCRHITRVWGPCASAGSTTNPLELGRMDPSWDNPSHPSPQHGQASSSCPTPPWLGAGGVFGAGGPRAGGAPRFRAGFMEQAGFQLGPSQNQPIRYSPDLRLGFTAPLCKGEDAQSHSSCPPQPVSRQNRHQSCGVGALVGEQRVGLH